MEILEADDWVRPMPKRAVTIRRQVAAMIETVEREGEAAIRRFSLEYDGFEPQMRELRPWRQYPLSEDTRHHMSVAATRIERFGRLQLEMYGDREFSDAFGRYGHRVVPLESMAAYIPGGRYPLISTALMTLIPARLAGVTQRFAVSPSDHPGILAAASLAGATGFLHLGGAQAIAAVALGCSLLDPVQMVVGPGNAYVNAAKALLQERVKIDTLAGPSELLILSDQSPDPRWLALDILAQAEHDPMALSVLACDSRVHLEKTAAAIEVELARHPEKQAGLVQLIYCRDSEAMIRLANQMAPEHLHLIYAAEQLDPNRLHQYGSLFLGARSPVALGDYCSGPNHTLPTMGYARIKGGLQVGDFLKLLTYQEIWDFDPLARTAIQLAREEGLAFHRQSLEVRLQKG